MPVRQGGSRVNDSSSIDFVMPLVIELIVICGLDIGFILIEAKKWMNERIIKIFPNWNGSKKPLYWFVIWGVIKFVIDIAVIIVFIFIAVEKYGLVMIAFGIGVWVLMTIIQIGLYLLLERVLISIIKSKIDDSKTKDLEESNIEESMSLPKNKS